VLVSAARSGARFQWDESHWGLNQNRSTHLSRWATRRDAFRGALPPSRELTSMSWHFIARSQDSVSKRANSTKRAASDGPPGRGQTCTADGEGPIFAEVPYEYQTDVSHSKKELSILIIDREIDSYRFRVSRSFNNMQSVHNLGSAPVDQAHFIPLF